MTKTSNRIPSLRLHKPSGLAVVTLCGQDHYLGQHKTPESQARYDELIQTWLQNGRTLKSWQPQGETLESLYEAYLKFVQSYYVKRGRPTSEQVQIRAAIGHLIRSSGHVNVEDFSAFALKRYRDGLIEEDLSRKVINQHVERVRRMISWGVSEKLAPPTVLVELKTVKGLSRGRSQAREAPPVKPVPEELIEAVIKIAHPIIGTMIKLQLITGMRPGEVIQMRNAEIDKLVNPWCYRPREHKTEHHDRERLIFLGPECQSLLEAFSHLDPEEYLFSPRQVTKDHHARYMRRRFRGVISQ